MATYALTFETITPESAEEGDFAARGFEREPTTIERLFANRGKSTIKGAVGEVWTFRDAIEDARAHGCVHPSVHPLVNIDARTWFLQQYAEAGTDEEFRAGALTYYSAHFGGVTDSTMRRIARLLTR